jgi:hypothetical protein
MNLRGFIILIIICSPFVPASVSANAPPISEATQECLECHGIMHPGIVQGWRKSRHARNTPGNAMKAQELARKVSSTSVPEVLKNTVVGCAECHTLRPNAHADTFDHNGFRVHVVVSPDDCKTCHIQERRQFAKNLMSHARKNLVDNPMYQALRTAISGEPVITGKKIKFTPAGNSTKAITCDYCHGTQLKVVDTETRKTEFGDLEFPRINGWPNQGTGRMNLDGSQGACSACHTRHTFSIKMARQPYTCKECHVGPDVPVFKVYAASKHGNIFSAMKDQWNFSNVPWTIGGDFTAPTCATCHVSLLVNTEGEMVAKRSHQMNNRLSWRIFGLIYSHPHPENPDTTRIRNKDGLPLPTDFNGGFASEFLIDKSAQRDRQAAMQSICMNCHGRSWVERHYLRYEDAIHKTNRTVKAATGIMQNVWSDGLGQFDTVFSSHGRRRRLCRICRRILSYVQRNHRPKRMV